MSISTYALWYCLCFSWLYTINVWTMWSGNHSGFWVAWWIMVGSKKNSFSVGCMCVCVRVICFIFWWLVDQNNVRPSNCGGKCSLYYVQLIVWCYFTTCYVCLNLPVQFEIHFNFSKWYLHVLGKLPSSKQPDDRWWLFWYCTACKHKAFSHTVSHYVYLWIYLYLSIDGSLWFRSPLSFSMRPQEVCLWVVSLASDRSLVEPWNHFVVLRKWNHGTGDMEVQKQR